jgi:DNA-binding NarL/FixJ family response regulator
MLVDDHEVVRAGLKALISSQGDMLVVGEAGDGLAACRLASELKPDVVVMDVTMPGLGGAAATERILHEDPGVRVLALTVHETDGYLRQLLGVGASGYVLKRSAAEDLIMAIRAVAAGGLYLDPKAAEQVVGGLVKPAAAGHKPETQLTDREVAVVKLLARGHINREIADQLELSIKTVEIYKAKALEKLGLRSRADLVQYAMERGWLFEG